jgi:hypothetical protein
MSVAEILHQIEGLPLKERWEVLAHTRHLLGSDVPAEFAEGMRAIETGETVNLDDALPELRSE